MTEWYETTLRGCAMQMPLLVRMPLLNIADVLPAGYEALAVRYVKDPFGFVLALRFYTARHDYLRRLLAIGSRPRIGGGRDHLSDEAKAEILRALRRIEPTDDGHRITLPRAILDLPEERPTVYSRREVRVGPVKPLRQRRKVIIERPRVIIAA